MDLLAVDALAVNVLLLTPFFSTHYDSQTLCMKLNLPALLDPNVHSVTDFTVVVTQERGLSSGIRIVNQEACCKSQTEDPRVDLLAVEARTVYSTTLGYNA